MGRLSRRRSAAGGGTPSVVWEHRGRSLPTCPPRLLPISSFVPIGGTLFSLDSLPLAPLISSSRMGGSPAATSEATSQATDMRRKRVSSSRSWTRTTSGRHSSSNRATTKSCTKRRTKTQPRPCPASLPLDNIQPSTVQSIFFAYTMVLGECPQFLWVCASFRHHPG